MSLKKQDYLDNQGGLWNLIYFIAPDKIATFGKIYHNMVNDFTLQPGIDMDYLWMPPGSAAFIQEKKSGEHGAFFQTSIRFPIPKNSQELLRKVMEMDGGQYVVVVRDNNDIWHVAGTPDEPLHFSADMNSGSSGSLNGFEASFSRDMRSRSLMVAYLPS